MAKREKWIDSKGRDVPAEYVPAYLKRRDRFVRKFRARTEKTSAALVALHAELQEAFPAYIDRAAASYDVQVGGEKGNVELLSFDGLTKLVRRNHDSLAFDERLGFARESIDKAMQPFAGGQTPACSRLSDGPGWRTATAICAARACWIF